MVEELVVVGKTEKVLDKLLSVCDAEDIILCGGVVIFHYFKKNSLDVPFVVGQQDLDVKVRDLETLKRILNNSKDKFKIAHYHDYSQKKGDYFHIDRFYGVLKDEETGIKIDIFDYENFVPQELIEFTYKGKKVMARSLEDQIVTKMLETYRVLSTANKPNAFDSKTFAELYWLVSISNPKKIQKLWESHPYQEGLEELYPQGLPEKFETAYSQALVHLYHHPEIVKKSTKDTSTSSVSKEKPQCPECIEFP